MKKITLCFLMIVMFASSVFAYDATFNFTQQYPELVSGFKIKAGGVKGGSYPFIIDCGKPAVKVDGSFDCTGTGLTANPVYAVVVNVDAVTGKESVASAEANLSITVPPPANLKIILKVTTTSSLTKSGNLISSTTIKRSTVPSGTVVKEGTTGYRNSKGQYISTTTIAMN